MDYIEVRVTTTHEASELLADQLAEITGGCSVDDPQTVEDFVQAPVKRWDYIEEQLFDNPKREPSVCCYLSPDEDGARRLREMGALLAELKAQDETGFYGSLKLEVSPVRSEDWENNWKQYFKPFRVGETFLIKPSWEQCEPEEGRRILEIDPSSSFGTGTHNTTQLCICELERLVKSGDRLLDMGCGSGILSVAAHMLGAEDVTAVDIDPNAVRIAAENAEKNGFALHTGVGDVIGDAALSARIGGDYDIIVANIVADVIMGMQDILKSKLKREGTLIVSGIIAPRADEVQASLLGAGFVLDRRDQSGDWVAMTLHQA